jgi:signal peptidase I
MDLKPPPLPQSQGASWRLRDRFALGIPGLVIAAALLAVVLLRVLGLLRPFTVPTAPMAPAIAAGDRVLMEGITFLGREPRRGDIVVFRTTGISPTLRSGEIHVQRVAGEPGERLRMEGGELFINEQRVVLSNAAGEIRYSQPPAHVNSPAKIDIIIPDGCYFVLGDNSPHSFDSRWWGTVPRRNIIGRIWCCYSPSQRIGRVK